MVGKNAGFGSVLRTMQDSDKSWLNGYAENYRQMLAEGEKKRLGKETEDAEFSTGVRARREESKAENAERSRRAWEALYRQPKWHPMSDADAEKLFSRAREPALIKLAPTHFSWPALINPPVPARREKGILSIAGERGILGLGLVNLAMKRLGI